MSEQIIVVLEGLVPARVVAVLVLDLLPGGRKVLLLLAAGEIIRTAPNRTEGLALGLLDLRRVRAVAPFEVQMLANRVVEDSHGYKGYSGPTTFAASGVARKV